jgi:lysophospholipase L1-like esterase
VPRGCLRSDHNYPSLVAARLKGTVLVDVSCSGAKTGDLSVPQRVQLGWQNAPQLDAVTAATTLVTLGIGGNDIGFTDIAISCGTMGLFNPAGAPCAKKFNRDLEQRVAATGPRVAAVLQSIRQRAPRARVLVVGYPRLLPPGAGCWPVVPLGPADTVYLDGVERELNAMLRAQAGAAGAEFVDAYAGGLGHDMCADAQQRWVEGIVPTAPAAPLHPNARGMRAVADRVFAALGGARVSPAPLVTAPLVTAPVVTAPHNIETLPGAVKGPVPATAQKPAVTAPGKGPALPVPGRGPALPFGKGPAPAAPGKGLVPAAGKGPAPVRAVPRNAAPRNTEVLLVPAKAVPGTVQPAIVTPANGTVLPAPRKSRTVHGK